MLQTPSAEESQGEQTPVEQGAEAAPVAEPTSADSPESTEAATPALIAEDSVTELSEGQLKKQNFFEGTERTDLYSGQSGTGNGRANYRWLSLFELLAGSLSNKRSYGGRKNSTTICAR